jgi:hypothetical protein
MSYIRQTALPPVEPVLLAEMKNFLKIPPAVTPDDALITQLITAAREQAEIFTGITIAQRTFVQNLDSFPYYVDTIMSQQAYPPNYYSNPRYSTTLWNYSQQMKLYNGPLGDVENIQYIDGSGGTQDGELRTLLPGVDFVVDYLSLEPRIFPLPGAFWPSVKYVPNAVLINFTSGYDPDPTKIKTVNVATTSPPNQQPLYTFVIGIPLSLKTAIMMLVAHWYSNREPVVAGGASTLPFHVESILWSYRVEDVSPTRG